MCRGATKHCVSKVVPVQQPTIAALALAAGGAPADATIGVMIGGNDQINRRLLRGFRRDESVADEFGLRFLDTARLSSRGLAELMRRTIAQRALPENRQSQYYQTHPGAADRLAVYNDHLQQSPFANSGLADTSRQLMTRRSPTSCVPTVPHHNKQLPTHRCLPPPTVIMAWPSRSFAVAIC